jgi:polyhydroxyalkanoate synthesis regulator phasin
MLRKTVKKGIRAGLKVAAFSAKEGIKVMRPLIAGGKLSKAEAVRAARRFSRLADIQRRKAQAAIERKIAAEIARIEREVRKKKRR